MIDPKTAWLLAKATFRIFILLVKSAVLISMIYFAVFTISFFEPFFNTTNNTTLVHEAKLVYICCYIVIGFLSLLIGEQLVGVVLSLVPGKCSIIHKPKALWFRISYIIVVGILLSAALFGTLYPLMKALAWRGVFAAAGRADLEEQATTLVVFMGMTLVVGVVSLLRLSWGLFVQCCGASGECCCRRSKKGHMEQNSGLPL